MLSHLSSVFCFFICPSYHQVIQYLFFSSHITCLHVRPLFSAYDQSINLFVLLLFNDTDSFIPCCNENVVTARALRVVSDTVYDVFTCVLVQAIDANTAQVVKVVPTPNNGYTELLKLHTQKVYVFFYYW